MLLTVFGAGSVRIMLLSYALEDRAATWVLVFALACAASSLYGWLVSLHRCPVHGMARLVGDDHRHAVATNRRGRRGDMQRKYHVARGVAATSSASR